MPPSHHSGSSHHHGGSHHSSSSHRSFSHSSSSYRSGGTRSSRPSYMRYTHRIRIHQPLGYRSTLSGYIPPTMYVCEAHDYVFYPTDWTDPETGKQYQKGYYDETGTYYKDLALKDATGKYTSKLVCDYCGTEIRAEWTDDSAPSCPNCGAVLREVLTGIAFDRQKKTVVLNDSDLYGTTSSGPLLSFIVWGLMILWMISIPLFELSGPVIDFLLAYSDHSGSRIVTTVTPHEDSIYVEEIGRTCKWYDSYESYYDSTTDCYFWYNTDIEPNVWQYWYEDISSDYGEYGWMEYDETEDCWYIEVSNSHWEILPDKYDTYYLWHIEE